jgi:NADH-quinone oxidoreductase subunit N
VHDLNWLILTPSLVIAGFALAVLCVDIISPRNRGVVSAVVALVGSLAAMVACYYLWGRTAHGLGDMLALDSFSLFANLIFLSGTALTIAISVGYLKQEGAGRSEYYLLLLTATLGMMLMASATDLLMIFLGLELMSLSLYVLAGFTRGRLVSNEASLKYLLLGAFASGFLLYGIALVYGAVGSTSLRAVAEALSQGTVHSDLLLVSGMGLLIVGLAFKVAAVPFHMWAPDVYEGAPAPVAAFMSAGPKAAAFAAFLRVLVYGMGPLDDHWRGVLWVLAVLTMTVGNLSALGQHSIKRMLAYSSVAHAGYVLVALVAGGDSGTSAALFYLLAYTFMNLGAFAVVILVARKGEENLDISGYAGLGFRHPVLGLAMTVFMLSLAGLPPTAGFFGKFYIFSAAVQAGQIPLTVIGVLNSLVSVYFYLGVVVNMYMKRPLTDAGVPAIPLLTRIAVLVAVAATLYLGLSPAGMLSLASETVTSLM